ncbi:leucine aminopeptidase 1-like [Cucumis melo var. makuwa]|uniref:Leucine aminopeptidase 1-like n=2 Tax=Cucumis melo TaxID=3656 RepID=A0A5D3BD80_CUCMM|nr:leucine aminopeptidase 1-like isoform X2 [Cucumis melo]KAA0056102.1 leucine aminopeptidase 1-like [Cucumis melo var. makuwa]TYJ96415.1 leucine aminopeptidase 1-like [Cucumis melo var. makuwa]
MAIRIPPTLGLTRPGPSNAPKITFAAKDTDVLEWNGDLLAVGVTEKDVVKDDNNNFTNPLLQKLDALLGGLLAEASSEEDFSGKSGQAIVLRVSGLSFKRVGLFALGQSASRAAAFVGLGEAIAAAAQASRAVSVAFALAFSADLSDEWKPAIASSIAIGIVNGIFDDNRYRSNPKATVLQSVDVLGLGSGAAMIKRLKYAQYVSSGIVFVRELVNSPANILTPGQLAAEVLNLTRNYSDVLSARIFDEEEIIEMKMGSYLGVTAAATANPPKFIHLCYKPPSGSVSAKLGLVGKGITFDSGGYNLKAGSGSNIETMKNDMGGAGAIFGAAKAIAEIKPLGVEIHFVVAACENMISATGMRPSDIVTAANGKTIEVNNTDAEGRLCLADALIYTCKQGVDKIIDLATLTGACITALGPSVAAAFTPSEELANEVLSAAERSGEKLWRLPIEESYWESMKSGVADMVNTGPSQGGAITAALFLKQFVDENIQWMHLDIAGPVWNTKKSVGTGFGVSTLVEWVLKNAS